LDGTWLAAQLAGNVPVGSALSCQRRSDNPRVPLPDAFLRPVGGYNAIGYKRKRRYLQLPLLAGHRAPAFHPQPGVRRGMDLSKALDFNDGEFADQHGRAVPPLELRLAGFDRRQSVKVNWLWDVPSATGKWRRCGSR